MFKRDQLLEAELDPRFSDQELALGLQTQNIREVFDEFREVFDPDLDDTLVQDSINQVDEVLSDGNNSPIDRQAGKRLQFLLQKKIIEKRREMAVTMVILLSNHGLKGCPNEANKQLKPWSGRKH